MFTGYVRRLLKQPNIYYISDRAGWAFQWVAHYIAEGVRRHDVEVEILSSPPWRAKRKIIHFGDRYAYLNGPFSSLDPSNYVFLSWFHGDPNHLDWRDLFANLQRAAPAIKKIVVSCTISREQLVSAGIPKEKLALIPIGVDLDQFVPPTAEQRKVARQKLNIPDDTFCIGSFVKDGAGWGEGCEPKLIKGPDIFLEVLQSLVGNSIPLFVLLTGPARGYIKQGLGQIGIPYIHHFVNNYHDMVSYYHAVDLCLITSRAEGGPQALMESWSTGVPVVSTRMGMSADLIRHRENGILAEVDDVVGLAQGVIELVEHPELRDEIRQNALQAIKPYDWQLITELYYQQLYQPLLNQSAIPRS